MTHTCKNMLVADLDIYIYLDIYHLSIYLSRYLSIYIHILYIYIYICELCHWPFIASMSPQSHCGGEEDGRIGLSS